MRLTTAQKTSDLARTSVNERPTVANRRSVRGVEPRVAVKVTMQQSGPDDDEYDGGRTRGRALGL